MFYVIEANSEGELKEKVNQLDRIFINNKAESLGQEISEGNIAKWFYEEQGHWLYAHNLWGLVPGFESLDAECKVPILAYPAILQDLDQWDFEHKEDMDKILNIAGMRPVTGSGPIILLKGNTVELTCGFTSFSSYIKGEYHPELEEINLSLWKSILERVTKHGVMWYMMGDITSRLMVDIEAYGEDFYKVMKSLKLTLDPNGILSTGKYNFWLREV